MIGKYARRSGGAGRGHRPSGLIGMKASEAVGRNPGARRRSWSSRFWPSPSPKRSCSTRCSSCSRSGARPRGRASMMARDAACSAVRPRGGGQVERIARTFGVDWPHLIAQIISFGIVCALLYWLAYTAGPADARGSGGSRSRGVWRTPSKIKRGAGAGSRRSARRC